MPRISVVVPIYNVEDYLTACLESLAAQTAEDLEVVMVDDGSTDGSAAIARSFAARDPRFKLISQPNGGLSKARNTGADAATGEFLAFVDSDDVVPSNAYELLLGSLDATGSDFATGNVHRLTRSGTRQSPFLAATFTRTRPKTHVTQFRPLLADRIVPNKLWRRSFWDAHHMRFPEGVFHEDIPVVLPAHFQARSVDVIADPVYLYRIREGASLSITQRRLEQRVMLDRLAALEHVSRTLADGGPPGAKRWYDASVVADDLRYYLNALDGADDAYRAVFLDRVNAFLDGADEHVLDELPAIDRLKWHLARRRLQPELLEVLRFAREDLRDTPPVRVGRHWYGDYPFRTDERLRIPASVYLVDRELELSAAIDRLCRDGDRLRIEGWAFVTGIGAPAPDTQRVTVTALRPGRLARLRLLTSGIRLDVTARRRPDVTAGTDQRLADTQWAGFEAVLDPRRLRRAGRMRDGTWNLYVTVAAGSIKRRRSKLPGHRGRPLRAVELPVGGDVAVSAGPSAGGIAVRVDSAWARIDGHRFEGDVVALEGELRAGGGDPALEAIAPDGTVHLRLPLAAGGGRRPVRFGARVPVAELLEESARAADEPDAELQDVAAWTLALADGGGRHPVRLADGIRDAVRRRGDRQVALTRTRQGDAALVARSARPLVTAARWTPDGELEVGGTGAPPGEPLELVVLARDRLETQAWPLERDGDGGFRARLAPARVASLGGDLPLREGAWELGVRPAGEVGEAAITPAMLAEGLHDRVPVATVAGHKALALGTTRGGRAILLVERDLDEDERGPYNQRRLRVAAYAMRRGEPLRDAVVFSSFGGRQYSDSPRAVHEELVRRGAPLEHLWVVRDGACHVPATARAVREGSREHYEALARARFVVANDHFPPWFERRADQVCLQTWHGTPLKRLGLDVSDQRKSVRRFQRRWERHLKNWQYVVSPNRFSTPILQRAYGVQGEMLETGYPRDDVLARDDRDVLGARVRERIGLPEDATVVLYAPTYRDHVIDGRGRYRLEQRLDVERLRRAVDPRTVILYRKHHYVADAVPVTADGFVRDASTYPDGTELLLAADVLVTDYSSMLFDFANTGRPMLFFTYDLDTYRDEIRGFYFDFEARAPGPLLRTTDELADALGDLDGVREAYAARYDDLVSSFCDLDDGAASARVVERVFGPWGAAGDLAAGRDHARPAG